MILVSKFGGSSMANSSQFEKVKDIVLSNPDRQIVCCSALGKRKANDTKITDLLYAMSDHLKYKVAFDDIWEIFYSRYVEVKKELKLKQNIEKELVDLKNSLNANTSVDYLVSRGEYFTAKLLAEYLGYTFVDAKGLIFFDYDCTIDYKKTEAAVRLAYEKYGRMVVPGFYGTMPNGMIKLLSRGGSDITGSILAKSVSASVYENWTDVSGVYTCDPAIVDNPRPIKEITYSELREMSYMGANVLHEETIFPVQELLIPINIKNTNDANHPGTMIKKECSDNKYCVTGITGKKGFMAFNISKQHMAGEIGFLRRLCSIFEKYNLPVEHMPTGIDSVSVICEQSKCEKNKYEIVSDIKFELQADVDIDEDLSLIAVVGRNMVHKIGLCGKMFTVLGKEKINVKMVDVGPTELTTIIGVSKKDYIRAIEALYKNIVESELSDRSED